MKVVILAIGSVGDVRPCVLLAKRLISRGHDAKLIAYNKLRALVEGNGVPFICCPGDADEFMAACVGKGKHYGIGTVIGLIKVHQKHADEIKDVMLKTCGDADILLFATYGSLFMSLIGEALHKPYMRISFWPDTPSKDYPFLGIGEWPFGKFLRKTYNIMSHKIVRACSNIVNIYAFRNWIGEFGLPKRVRYGTDNSDGTPIEELFAYSENFIKRGEDYGENVHITGYWIEKGENKDYKPPEKLVEFLDKCEEETGEKPVYIGFGSVPGDLGNVIGRFVEVLGKCGKRAVLSTGWDGLDKSRLPDYIYPIDFVPHDWLFPRMKAVIHHGGAGTTAEAIRAGIPMMIIPFVNDQYFWARAAYKRGVAPKYIEPKKITDKTAYEILLKLDDPALSRKAKECAEQVSKEDGIGNACDCIEEYARKRATIE